MMKNYEVMEKVGSGNFSTVHLAKKIQTGEICAMKIMKTHKNIGLREAYMLKKFDHPNIIKLLDFSQDPASNETILVLEYLPENTLQLYEAQHYGLRQEQVKCILFQAALGLGYIHQKGIIHRDVKPQNILIDQKKAEIKIIDFGLAISQEKIRTDYVATRWYRAPQNLLGTKEYTPAIDIFSLGCVIVELYLGNPLFPGVDNIDQLYRIFNILGEPTEESWPLGFKHFNDLGLRLEYTKLNDDKKRMKKDEVYGLRNLLKLCDQGLTSLIQRMLILDPKNRITSRQILLDPYFKEISNIIPPHIYKRFEKDYLMREKANKTAESTRQIIKNAETLLRMSKGKLQRKSPTDQTYSASEKDTGHLPLNSHQNLSINIETILPNDCNLINLTLSPKSEINNNSMLTSNNLPSSGRAPPALNRDPFLDSSMSSPQLPHLNNSIQSQSYQDSNILQFRGQNPIKNKISIKQTFKKLINGESRNSSREKNSQNGIKNVSRDALNRDNNTEMIIRPVIPQLTLNNSTSLNKIRALKLNISHNAEESIHQPAPPKQKITLGNSKFYIGSERKTYKQNELNLSKNNSGILPYTGSVQKSFVEPTFRNQSPANHLQSRKSPIPHQQHPQIRRNLIHPSPPDTIQAVRQPYFVRSAQRGEWIQVNSPNHHQTIGKIVRDKLAPAPYQQVRHVMDESTDNFPHQSIYTVNADPYQGKFISRQKKINSNTPVYAQNIKSQFIPEPPSPRNNSILSHEGVMGHSSTLNLNNIQQQQSNLNNSGYGGTTPRDQSFVFMEDKNAHRRKQSQVKSICIKPFKSLDHHKEILEQKDQYFNKPFHQNQHPEGVHPQIISARSPIKFIPLPSSSGSFFHQSSSPNKLEFREPRISPKHVLQSGSVQLSYPNQDNSLLLSVDGGRKGQSRNININVNLNFLEGRDRSQG